MGLSGEEPAANTGDTGSSPGPGQSHTLQSSRASTPEPWAPSAPGPTSGRAQPAAWQHAKRVRRGLRPPRCPGVSTDLHCSGTLLHGVPMLQPRTTRGGHALKAGWRAERERAQRAREQWERRRRAVVSQLGHNGSFWAATWWTPFLGTPPL